MDQPTNSAETPIEGEEQNECHVWVAQYTGQRKDHLVVGPSDDLTDHAPAIAQGDTSNVDYLGTFKEFETNRDSINLDLPKMMPIDGEVTEDIGRERFWTVVKGKRMSSPPQDGGIQ